MIPPEHPKDLFKRQGAEKGRTVEHGAFQPDRTPRKEVGSLEFVTTLVEIPFHCFSVQRNLLNQIASVYHLCKSVQKPGWMSFQNRPYGVQTVVITFQNGL